MATSWSTPAGGSDWSQGSSWRGSGPTAGANAPGGMWGSAVMPLMPQGGGMQITPGQGMGGAPQQGQPWWATVNQQGAPQDPNAMAQMMRLQADPNAGMPMQAGAAVMPQIANIFGTGGAEAYTQARQTQAGQIPSGGALQTQGAPQQQGAPQAGPQGGPPPTSRRPPPAPPTPTRPPPNQSPGSREQPRANYKPPYPLPGSDPVDEGGLFGGDKQTITQTFNPWAPQGKGLEKLYGRAEEEWKRQQALGGPKFSQESREAMNRMEQLATGGNPNARAAMNAVGDIAGGDTKINTANKFNELYNREGVTNARQYNKLYNDGTFSNEQTYKNMMNESPIKNIGEYNDLARTGGITGGQQWQDMARDNEITTTGDYAQMAQQNAIGNDQQYRDLYKNEIGSQKFNQTYNQMQNPGDLDRGMFSQIAQGNLINGNPHREQNIKQSMGDTAKMVKASMSKAGRYGSDAYGDAMGKALSSVATQARERGYDTDTSNMMAAAQARSGESLGMAGLGLQAAQGTLSAQQSTQANRLAAAQGLSGTQAQNMQLRQAALAGQTGAQAQNAAMNMQALTGMNAAQNQAAQNQLGAMGQRNQAQLSNQQSQFAALQGLTNMQNLQGQQQLAAAQGLSNIQGQNAQQRMQAAQGLTGVQGQNIANQMQAAGMAPEMQKLRYDDMNRLLGIGATKEAMTQQQRDFGWNNLQQLQNTYGGLPGQAGQSNQQTQEPWWKQAAGLGMLGLGMFG